MLQSDPEGFDFRDPTQKVKVPQCKGHLTGLGVFEELHLDGHEKLNWKALGLGRDVGIDIYGMKDHSSGTVVAEYVVPNARCEDTVAHCYLDMVEEYGGMLFESSHCPKSTDLFTRNTLTAHS